MEHLRTPLLDLAYHDEGPPGGLADAPVALLLHGWPDDPSGLAQLAGLLRARGYRTLRPYLRGFGPTRFLREKTLRDGRSVALARDALDLLDGLGVERCLLVGHDWGARTAYTLAALAPQRWQAVVAMGVAYAPHGRFETPPFEQARLWWYQWLMTTQGGAERVRADPIGFARIQWDHWSPPGWFTEREFAEAAGSFTNPDWVDITLHSYRSRWREEPLDPRYGAEQEVIAATGPLAAPTLLIMGEQDGADLAAGTAGKEALFTARYRRVVLSGVGHFPAREAAAQVDRQIAEFVAGG